MAPAVSVIIPVYNVEAYLRQTIESVLAQSLHDLELIIIDDASTDGSLAIAQSLAEQDGRVQVHPLRVNTPGGAGIPSNIGMEFATGKYIAFLDSDDWYGPNFLEELCTAAEGHQAELAIARFQIYDMGKGLLRPPHEDAWAMKKLSSSSEQGLLLRSDDSWDASTAELLFGRLSYVPWRKLYLRSFVEKHRLRYPECDFFYEDVPLHWQACASAQRIAIVDDCSYQHRMGRPGQTIGAKAEQQLRAKLYQEVQVWQLLAGLHGKRSLYRALCMKRLAEGFLYNFPQVDEEFCQWSLSQVEDFVQQNITGVLSSEELADLHEAFAELVAGRDVKRLVTALLESPDNTGSLIHSEGGKEIKGESRQDFCRIASSPWCRKWKALERRWKYFSS